jgi:predicted ester cyclase
MSIEENKEVVRVFYEYLRRKEFDSLYDIIAPEFKSHRTTGDISREDLIQGCRRSFDAFPDNTFTIEDMVAEGDRVAYRVTVRGTHRGEYMGITPTGNKIEQTNQAIIRISDGKWIEAWATLDDLRMMQQLGAIPSQ